VLRLRLNSGGQSGFSFNWFSISDMSGMTINNRWVTLRSGQKLGKEPMCITDLSN